MQYSSFSHHQGRHGYQHFQGGSGSRSQPPHHHLHHDQFFYLLPPPPLPPPPPPLPTNFYHPNNHGYYPGAGGSGSQHLFNSSGDGLFPGHYYSVNAGGNRHVGPGFQRNGEVRIGYGAAHAGGNLLNNGEIKRKKRKSTLIGGCHNNQGGHQSSGDIFLGDIH